MVRENIVVHRPVHVAKKIGGRCSSIIPDPEGSTWIQMYFIFCPL